MKKLSQILGLLLLLGILGCNKSDEGNQAPAPKQASSQNAVLKLALKETAENASSKLSGGDDDHDHSGNEVTSVTSSSSGGFRTYTITTASGYTASYVFSNTNGYTTVSVITPGGSQDFGGSVGNLSGDCLEKALQFLMKWENYNAPPAGSDCQSYRTYLNDVKSLLTDIKDLLNTCSGNPDLAELQDISTQIDSTIQKSESVSAIICAK